MPSLGNTLFKGRFGKTYQFRVFALGTRFRKISGVYVITNRSRNEGGEREHEVLFVGQTEDLSQPFDRHRKAKELQQHGANCICLQSDNSEGSRLAKERDLLVVHQPPCNR